MLAFSAPSTAGGARPLDVTLRGRRQLARGVARLTAVAVLACVGGCTRPNPEFGLLLVGGTDGGESDAGGSTSDSGSSTGTTRGSGSQGSESGGASSATTAGVTSDEPSTTSTSGPSSSSSTSNASTSATSASAATSDGSSSSSSGTTDDPDPTDSTTDAPLCPGGVERLELVPDADSWVMRGSAGLTTCLWGSGFTVPLPLPCSLVNFGTTSVHYLTSIDQPTSVMILGFPLDELPAGARIQTAWLSVRVQALEPAGPGVNLKAYAIGPERFAEGNADGGLNTEPGITWDCFAQDGQACLPWPGGAGPLEGAVFVGAVVLDALPNGFESVELSNTQQLERWSEVEDYAVYAVSAEWPRADELFTFARESGDSTPVLELEYCVP